MANCIKPYLVKDKFGKYFPSRCGGCLPCRKLKASIVKRVCELTQQEYYKRGLSCSFNCLTYDSANVPLGSTGLPTLSKYDYQKFFKRFRDYLKRDGYKEKFSYIGCGEYGDDHLPHYHFILFGLSDVVADKYMCKAWRSEFNDALRGIVDCKPLLAGGISYVADYVITALNGDYAKQAYDDKGIERPFMTHSTGMGISYLMREQWNLADNNYIDMFSGKPWFVPSYYRKYYHLAEGRPVAVRPFVEREAREARKLGLSVERYQRMQQEVCIKNAVNQSRIAGVPVENEILLGLSDSKLIKDAIPRLAQSASDWDDKIPF